MSERPREGGLVRREHVRPMIAFGVVSVVCLVMVVHGLRANALELWHRLADPDQTSIATGHEQGQESGSALGAPSTARSAPRTPALAIGPRAARSADPVGVDEVTRSVVVVPRATAAPTSGGGGLPSAPVPVRTGLRGDHLVRELDTTLARVADGVRSATDGLGLSVADAAARVAP